MATLCRRISKYLMQPGHLKRGGSHAVRSHLLSTTAPTSAEDEVLFETSKNCGVITLNRPKALNALNLDQIQMIHPVLKEWDDDPNINVIMIKGSGEKAFCAGGDVVAVTSKGEPSELSEQFFKEEYQLNYEIANLRTPYIAMIHGITMGGGVGLSVHGRYRVATEKTLFAMPETAIGLFPDVGGGHFLPRLPNNLGMFLALTGNRLKGWDTYCAGIATHYVTSFELPYLQDELCNMDNPCPQTIDKHLDDYHRKCWSESAEFSLQKHLSNIEDIFSADSVEAILERLEADGSEWALKQLNLLKKMSPSSMKLTLRQLQAGCTMNLKEVLEMEYRMSQGCMRNNDFYEGIRALLVDRDNAPVWSPGTLGDVSQELVDSYFQPLPEDKELVLPVL